MVRSVDPSLLFQHQPKFVWRMLKEVYNSECLVPTVKHGGRSEMIWAALSWCSACPVITLSGGITSSGWVDILDNQANQLVP